MFVDTGAFVARYRKSDSWHVAAVGGWNVIRRRAIQCYTTPLVFAEAARLLRPYAGGGEIARLLGTWFDLHLLTVLRSADGQERHAIDLMHKFADQETGFVDCISF